MAAGTGNGAYRTRLIGRLRHPLYRARSSSRPISEPRRAGAPRLSVVPTAMVRVPEAPHGLTRRPRTRIARIDKLLAWFERYRQPAEE